MDILFQDFLQKEGETKVSKGNIDHQLLLTLFAEKDLTHSYCKAYNKIFIIVEVISFLITLTMWLTAGVVTGLSSGK